MTTTLPLLIIGAGAAGLGASYRARELGAEHVVLEASHRTGGRALTERMNNGAPADLGCHWMHSASQNGMVAHADRLGFRYATTNPDPKVFGHGRWQNSSFAATRVAVGEAVEARISAATGDSARAILDYIDLNDVHAPWLCYWYALMHSNDPDQVDIADILDYSETGEDWPVESGYGALVAAAGEGAPVELNSPVTHIDWRATPIRVSTAEKEYLAERVLVTTSTGVLGAGDIGFEPALPGRYREAIEALPLGNYNNLFFALRPGALSDAPSAVAFEDEDHCAYIKIRPFGHDLLFTSVAGRFAWWLERQGERAAESWLRDKLIAIFGESINDALGQFRASAWGFDPWVKGAYSSLRPGAGPMRAVLAEPVGNGLGFAGEAVSPDAFNTAHGAWRSGQVAVDRLLV